MAGTARLIHQQEFAYEQRDRPSVRNDVVHDQRQNVVLTVKTYQFWPEQRNRGQLKRLLEIPLNDSLRLRKTLPRREKRQVHSGQRNVQFGFDNLPWFTFTHREMSA